METLSDTINRKIDKQRVLNIVNKIILNTEEFHEEAIDNSSMVIHRFVGENINMSYASDDFGEWMDIIVIDAKLGRDWGIIELNRCEDGDYNITLVEGNLSLEDTILMMENIFDKNYMAVAGVAGIRLADTLGSKHV